ncbi:TetR/AcrR family transcriptional regulator [Actinoplanes friuliensis]|jgi:AcrR family transcriptional regulator|uniref:HTH-type transcriptional regulator betI n=1 Tax=Actinoplanes friuliensis DSM 7358 TaxID=1246995 RepID=U5W2R6_9ACTN|nr:TetR/AcrR family transcriptional regulator [Actinoplanes friuliensis]AGZ42275.1 HTH-type transcriptional regulator betI [Actinoplanes friuliensis DSM 7358]
MTRTRLTAEQRHEQLLGAALTAFTTGGYAGTTTDQVARLAGVSQPYVIRLFGTKQQLFIATVEHASSRIEERFRAAAAQQADLSALGSAYDELLAERELITVLLHGFAAAADPAIGPVVRDCFGRLYGVVRELTGAGAEETRDFFAYGMLLTVLGAMNAVGPGAVATDGPLAALVGSLGDDKEPAAKNF